MIGTKINCAFRAGELKFNYAEVSREIDMRDKIYFRE